LDFLGHDLTMADNNQLWYLQLMGIDVWSRRELIAAESIANDRHHHLDWDSLQTAVAGCRLCGLCKTRTKTVFGVGNRQADLLIIGEAPGANEDLQGEPFVGRAGKLLDAMLQAIGLDRQKVYIANILKCRPPNNRDPSPEEVATCTPYLERQLALLQPKLIMAVGRIAAHFLLESTKTLGTLRGQIHHYGKDNTPLIVTYHPAYLLRSPREKAKAYEDLLKVSAWLASHR
jgi:uracil-DNA glycosylase